MKSVLSWTMRWGVLVISLGAAVPVSALTAEGFFQICEAGEVPCSENQFLQAYIGGALDMIASLSEATEYLDPVYCDEPRDVFRIPAMVAYMEEHRDAYAKRNAMQLVIRYLEEHGGC